MSLRHRILCCGLVMAPIALVIASANGTAEGREPALHKARQELRISEEMVGGMRRELADLRRSPDVTSAEIADYERYLARLEARVRENRRKLQRLEEVRGTGAALEDGGEAAQAARPPEFEVVPEMTEAEELDALDAELNASLNRFDAMLLEQMRSLRRSPAAGSQGEAETTATGVEARASARAVPAASDAGAMERPREETAAQRDGSQRSRRPPQGERSDGTVTVGLRVPPDIPDGSDDDVVARQIREAAENERDPLLRDKLWEEYRKYKRGAR